MGGVGGGVGSGVARIIWMVGHSEEVWGSTVQALIQEFRGGG